MSSVINIQPAVPREMVVPPLTSTSKNILRRRFETLTPVTSASDYSYTGNSRLEFLINSASDFWDCINSYIRMSVTTVLDVDGGDDTTKFFGVGGAHSLFSEIRLETSNGVVVQRIDSYSKFFSMMSVGLPQDYIEQSMAYSGDSVGDADVTHLGAAATQSAREWYAQTPTPPLPAPVMCFQPMLPFLHMGNFIPLSLIRGGLRLVLEMDAPAYSLGSNEATLGTGFNATTANIIISNPRYVVAFVQPSQEILAGYISQFNGDGISYTFQDTSHFLNTAVAGFSGTSSFQHNVNVRSATAIYSIIQNLRQNTITAGTAALLANTYSSDVGTMVKANLSEYQYFSGSLRFPLQRSIVMTSVDNAEAYQHYLTAQGKQGSSLFSSRANVEQWMERSSESGNTDSTRLVLAAKLGRGTGSPYAGLDLSLIPISQEFTWDAAYTVNSVSAIRYMHSWVLYDATITIGADGIVKRV